MRGMKRLAQLATFVVLFASTFAPGCAALCGGTYDPDPIRGPDTPASGKAKAVQINGNQGAWMSPIAVVQGNSVDVIVFSTTSQGDATRGMYPGLERVALRARFNQAVTIKYQTLKLGQTTWRTWNGSGSGDALAANTDYFTDFLRLDDDVRIVVTTGGTGPTTREVALRISNDRALGMFQ